MKTTENEILNVSEYEMKNTKHTKKLLKTVTFWSMIPDAVAAVHTSLSE